MARNSSTQTTTQTTTTATVAPPVTNGSVPKWTVTTISNHQRSKVPPPAWATELVSQSWSNKIALGHTFGSEKEARSALHQIRRAAAAQGLGLTVQQMGAELRVQAKERKKIPAPKGLTLNPGVVPS